MLSAPEWCACGAAGLCPNLPPRLALLPCPGPYTHTHTHHTRTTHSPLPFTTDPPAPLYRPPVPPTCTACAVSELDRMGVDRELLARRAVEAYLQQLLNHGFFHAGE